MSWHNFAINALCKKHKITNKILRFVIRIKLFGLGSKSTLKSLQMIQHIRNHQQSISLKLGHDPKSDLPVEYESSYEAPRDSDQIEVLNSKNQSSTHAGLVLRVSQGEEGYISQNEGYHFHQLYLHYQSSSERSAGVIDFKFMWQARRSQTDARFPMLGPHIPDNPLTAPESCALVTFKICETYFAIEQSEKFSGGRKSIKKLNNKN